MKDYAHRTEKMKKRFIKYGLIIAPLFSTLTTLLIILFLYLNGFPSDLLILIFLLTVCFMMFGILLTGILFIKNYQGSGIQIDDTFIYPYGVFSRQLRTSKIKIQDVDMIDLWFWRGQPISTRLKGGFGTITIDLEKDQLLNIVEDIRKIHANVQVSERTLFI